MRRRKEDYLLIGFAVVLITIVAIITMVALLQGNHPTPPQQSAPSPFLMPTTIPTAHTNPPIIYDTQAQKKLLNNVLNRQELITTDTTAKQHILSLLPQGEESGTLYSSENVQIEYIHGPDLFQAEILTTNIVEAKTEATAWFRKQGMSQEGICKLPLMFYLNWNVANLLHDTHIIFSPLPSNC